VAADKPRDVSRGCPSVGEFLKRTFKSAKNFKSPPTAKPTACERAGRDLKVKQNLHRRAEAVPQVGHSGSREKTPTGYRVRTQLKFRNSRSVHVHYLLKRNKKNEEREREREREGGGRGEERKNEKTWRIFCRYTGQSFRHPTRNRPIRDAAFSAELSASDEPDKLISSTLDYREGRNGRRRAEDTVGPGLDGEEDGREHVLHDAQNVTLHLIVRRAEENALAKVLRQEHLIGLPHEVTHLVHAQSRKREFYDQAVRAIDAEDRNARILKEFADKYITRLRPIAIPQAVQRRHVLNTLDLGRNVTCLWIRSFCFLHQYVRVFFLSLSLSLIAFYLYRAFISRGFFTTK